MLVEDFLSQSAERSPDKVAIVCGDQRLSFSALDGLASRFANMLATHGVCRGDRVAVLLDNSVEAAVAIFGILKAGAAFTVVSQTIKADKLAYILDDCSASALITQPFFFEMIRTIDTDRRSLSVIVSFGADAPLNPLSTRVVVFDEHQHSARQSILGRTQIDVDVAALIYTSGSTGFPKGVVVSHLNIISAATSITEYLENVADDVIINVLPLSFDYGLYQLLMSVKVGATLVLEKSFAYPYKIVQRVHEERVTGFPGVPTVFALLLQMKDIEPELMESVRYVSNTAAALPPAHIKRLRTLFKNAKIYSMYGLTECKRVSYLPPDELDRRPTSVGRGMPNVHVSVVDDDGKAVPPGTVGELVVRGSNVMLGYWDRPEETAAMIRPGPNPWERVLYTGDLFTMDDEGFLYFVARKDEIIKTRGEKVSPSEIERIIHELEEVREVAVVGVPDPVLGQALKAIVVLVGPGMLTARDIILHCGRRLESFMVPKEVQFRESLPKTSSGKISRKRVQHEFEDGTVEGT
jgi:long-chain acyl-CoA synthetase